MKRFIFWLGLFALLLPGATWAHVGSPDIFFDGNIGQWPAHITIRMPTVVPGQAQIFAQIQSAEPVNVSFDPLFSRIAVSNAPPPEIAQPVAGETNTYSGTLWLMANGAYSIEVRVKGPGGEGVVQIPVNSVATAQLPLPPWLGGILIVLGILLFSGAVAIVAAAAGESILGAGEMATRRLRRKYWIAASITIIVLALALIGGRKWWNFEEHNFRQRLHDGAWPDMAATIKTSGSQRILSFTLGERDFSPQYNLELVPDHGKLLHLFLVNETDGKSFAHIHPVREGNTTFSVTLPPLPAGPYELFCDLTFASGLSSTATNLVQLPPLPDAASQSATNTLNPDPDDSWAVINNSVEHDTPGTHTTFHFDDGSVAIWKAHPALVAHHDACLRFDILDTTGKPVVLEPYMGMMSHAAIMRSDGKVFAHLHPSGNLSMAAQMYFDAKLSGESGTKLANTTMTMGQAGMTNCSVSSLAAPGFISLPYEFPTPGDYRIWVQVKISGKIQTAVFDTNVE